MTIQITKIILTSHRNTYNNIYFRICLSDTFISSVSKKDRIVENVTLQMQDQETMILEIWMYEPQKMINKWSISSDLFKGERQKHMIRDEDWTVRFEVRGEATERSLNKQNRNSKDNKTSSSSKDIKLNTKYRNSNRSNHKDINLALLKKNKDKVGVKKALKTTIEYLIKKQKKTKRGQQQAVLKNYYSKTKTAKSSPYIAFLEVNKNQSALFTDYGFTSCEFNEKFTKKNRYGVENQENQREGKQERKKKIRGR